MPICLVVLCGPWLLLSFELNEGSGPEDEMLWPVCLFDSHFCYSLLNQSIVYLPGIAGYLDSQILYVDSQNILILPLQRSSVELFLGVPF